MFNAAAVGQFRKENVLCAENRLSGNDCGTSHFRLPEGHIEHVVQSKGNQSTFNNAVNPRADVAGTENQISQRGNARLYHRPDKEHDNTDNQKHCS